MVRLRNGKMTDDHETDSAATSGPANQTSGTSQSQAPADRENTVSEQPVAELSHSQIHLRELATVIANVARPPHKIKAPRFSSIRDLTEYLHDFNLVATKNGWGDEEAGVELQSVLEGEPLSLALSIPNTSFQAISKTLRERLTLRPDQARKAIQTLRMKSNDVDALAAQCRRMTERGYGSDGLQVNNHIMEYLKVQAFLEGLRNREMVHVIGPQEPKTLHAAVELAKAYLIRDEQFSKKVCCVNCTPDQIEDNETKTTIPDIAQLLQRIDQLTSNPPSKTEPLKCFICAGEHFAIGCPQRKPKNTQTGERKNTKKSGNE